MAFADDIILIGDNKQEVEILVKAMSELEEYGLAMNKTKTKFMTDRTDMKEI